MNKHIIILSVILATYSAAGAEENPTRAVYSTFGYKNLKSGSVGTGMSYGAGFKKGSFGMEIYQTNYKTIPANMERSSAAFNSVIGGAGTKTGEKVISDGGFGFDFNIYVPTVRRVELYFGPSMAFEKESDVYSDAVLVAQTTRKYADFPGVMKTRFSGQAGLIAYIPVYRWNVVLTAGYSAYRGITGGIGFGFL